MKVFFKLIKDFSKEKEFQKKRTLEQNTRIVYMKQHHPENPDWSVILTAYSDEREGLMKCLLTFKWEVEIGKRMKKKKLI